MKNGIWTATDEAAFSEMNVRRALVMQQRRTAVEETVDKFVFNGMTANDIVDALIDHAEDVRDALAPYDSGVRLAKGD